MSDEPRPLFQQRTATGLVIECKVCTRSGYGPIDENEGQRFAPWQEDCLKGHPHQCSCGRRFATRHQAAYHFGMHRKKGEHVTFTLLS